MRATISGLNGNPALVRREIETRYSEYMGRRRLLLGVVPSEFDVDAMGNNPEERAAAYDSFISRYPRKSQNLMRGVAHELVFEHLSRQNHKKMVNSLFPGIAEGAGGSSKELTFAYVSGLGRNALLTSLLNVGGGVIPRRVSIVSSNFGLESIVTDIPLDQLIFDPDFGMGDINGRTPELFGAEGSAELAGYSFGSVPKKTAA